MSETRVIAGRHPRLMPVEERFWEKVDRRGPQDCWPWMACKDRGKYGLFKMNGKCAKAHRIAWHVSHASTVPKGKCVLHTCDNPPCCNPAHLFLGTLAENRSDCVAKGRQARGDRHGMYTRPEKRARGERQGSAKLTEARVRWIRTHYNLGTRTNGEMATLLGVTESTVAMAAQGTTWTHL